MRPLQNLMSTTLALTFLVSLVSRSTAAEVCKQEPKLVSDEQKRISLLLPESVRKTIQADFPDFRVPSQADMKGLWATESEPLSWPAKGLLVRDFPWVGGLHLSGRRPGRRLAAEKMTLQNVFVRTIPNGEEQVIESTRPGGKAVESARYKFETDALEWTTVGGSVSLVHWKGRKYELLDFGSE